MKSEMRIQAFGATGFQKSSDYDVFVAPSGAVFEYGPRTMRVIGKATPCDTVAFVQHCRGNAEQPFPLVTQKRQVKVLGVRL